jgi:hypothetical protein
MAWGAKRLALEMSFNMASSNRIIDYWFMIIANLDTQRCFFMRLLLMCLLNCGRSLGYCEASLVGVTNALSVASLLFGKTHVKGHLFWRSAG